MANISDYLESGLLNYLFRANTNNFTRPLEIAVALCGNTPQDSQDGNTIPELPNANGYARANLGAPTNSIFGEIIQSAGGSGYIRNSTTITFGPATGNWGWVSGIAITDSGVFGAGRVLYHGILPTPREILVNDTLSFSAGNLEIYLA